MNEQLTGMDISQIRSMARSMDGKADEIRRLVDQLTVEVDRASWIGRDRDTFVETWRNQHAAALRRVADNLDEAAVQARDHATAQEQVSRASGGTSW